MSEIADLHARLAAAYRSEEQRRADDTEFWERLAALGPFAERVHLPQTIGSRCGDPDCPGCADGWHRPPQPNPLHRPIPPVPRLPWVDKNGWPGIPIPRQPADRR